MPIHKTLNHDFFKTWSPEMAYVLGYFAADGSMIEHKNGGHYVEFTTTDKVIFQKMRKAVSSNHKISKRPRPYKKWKQQYRIQFGSGTWFADLIALGFTPNKSNTLSFPKLPSQHIPDFVRGYFDGDGCVYFKKLKYADRTHKRWVLLSLFTSGSKIFLEKLHMLLKLYGVTKGTVKNKKRGFELVFSHHDSLALYRLMYHTNPTVELYLPRKRKLFTKAIQTLYPNAAVV